MPDDDDSVFNATVDGVYSDKLTDLIRRCLRYIPAERPSFVEIKESVRTASGEAIHDAAIAMRNADADDPRWNDIQIVTQNSHVPLALARDADGDVEMVGGPTGRLVPGTAPLPDAVGGGRGLTEIEAGFASADATPNDETG